MKLITALTLTLTLAGGAAAQESAGDQELEAFIDEAAGKAAARRAAKAREQAAERELEKARAEAREAGLELERARADAKEAAALELERARAAAKGAADLERERRRAGAKEAAERARADAVERVSFEDAEERVEAPVEHRAARRELPASVATAEAENRSDVGWRGGKRLPVYAAAMFLGESFSEDPRNRVTTRHRATLEGVGVLFRLGGVADLHSRVGIRMQSFVRPTKRIVRTATFGDAPWGVVGFGLVGPEYLYTTHSGLYVGASVGFAGIAAERSVEVCSGGQCGRRGGTERASFGGAAVGSVGYEWRFAKWIALNAEAFAGAYRGIDDDERKMGGTVAGFGFGLGL